MKECQPSGNVRILVDTLTIYSERLKTALDTEKVFDIVQNKFQKQIMKKKRFAQNFISWKPIVLQECTTNELFPFVDFYIVLE